MKSKNPHHDFDQEDYFSERKTWRQQRKIAIAKDRSKYKKTDSEKYRKEASSRREARMEKESHLMRGRVFSIASEGIWVEAEGHSYHCVLRGLIKKEKTLLKNLIVVGDYVRFEKLSPDEGAIAYVEPRYSTLSRADNLSQRKEQLIAANIDQVLIVASVVNPSLKPSLIDRYIVATIKGKMQPIILVNKIDLLEEPSLDPVSIEKEEKLYQELLEAHRLSQVPLIPISVKTGQGLEELKAMMKDRASVFSGQSGVGKTSLINAVTGLDLKTGETVEKTRKGSHTTTTASLMPLSFGGWCIDTPGIKSFGVWDLSSSEIQHYFPEIWKWASHCKFPNCSHSHEPGCAVEEAIKKGTVSPLRYESYLSLLQGIDNDHLRR